MRTDRLHPFSPSACFSGQVRIFQRSAGMNKRLLSSLLAAGAMFASSSVFAQNTEVSNINLSLTVIASCSFSATNASFGTQRAGAAGSAVDADSSITATCIGTPGTITGGPSFTVNGGLNSGSTTQRNLKSSTGLVVPYNVFSDSSRANSVNINTTSVPIGPLNNGTNNLGVRLYFRIVPNTNLPISGASTTFTDTLQLTFTY